MNDLSSLQTSSNNLLNWLLQGKMVSLQSQPTYVKKMLLTHLANVFNEIQCATKNEIIELGTFKESEYKDSCMCPVVDVKNIIEEKKYFKHFIIHGSTADLEVIPGWSDFDAIAVLDASIFEECDVDLIDTCIDLDRVMRKIDKYQHHGIHYIHEKELEAYPQLYLPKQLLPDGKCLLGSRKVQIRSVGSRGKESDRFCGIVNTLVAAAESGWLNHHPLNGKFLKEDYEDGETMYQLKYFLCVLMLLPSLWFNLQGVYCKKKESFDMIKERFDERELEILLSASNIRNTWRDINPPANTIPAWVRNELGKGYLEKGAIFASMLKDSIE